MQDYNQKIDHNIETFERNRKNYPSLDRAGTPLMRPAAPILGRDMSELRLALRNPEKANVILLGDPGSGKTAFMQGFTYNEQSVQYLVISVDVERLVKDNGGDKDAEMANGLQDLVMEASQYSKEHNIIMVLFIDEFHRIAMLSPASVEALKPILEKSSHNGFRVVAATTFEEYDQWIASNRALDQRLLRMSLPELPREAVMNILESRAKQYNVLEYVEDGIFGEIYDVSKQILISNSQPRASIDILNNIIGNITKNEYMQDGQLVREYATCEDLNIPGDKVLGRAVLNHVIRRSYGIDIDNKVSVHEVRDALNNRIYNQDQAVSVIMSRLELMLAGFNDPTRPKISVLMTGATGTGKTELTKVIAETLRVPLKRFDMSRYSRPDDAVSFADHLAQAAWSAPNGIILIDEVEKSSREAINNLLQVFDDARLTAAGNPNRVISFSGNIIFITTNLGSEVYQHNKRYDKEGELVDTELIYKALLDDPRFEQAVLGRIDAIVPFLGLPESAISKIAERELKTNIALMETNKRRVLVSPDIIPYIVKDRTSADTERGGARDAKRNVKNIVIQKLASYLAHEPKEVPVILFIGGKPRFRFSNVVDPLSGYVDMVECYPREVVENWIKQLSQKLNRQIIDCGLFVPITWQPNDFATAVVKLVKSGKTRIKTSVDLSDIRIEAA